MQYMACRQLPTLTHMLLSLCLFAHKIPQHHWGPFRYKPRLLLRLLPVIRQMVSTMDYTRFLSEVSKGRQATILRDLFKLQLQDEEDWIYLIGGLPNADYFPFTSGTLKMADGETLEITPPLMVDALQYGNTIGYSPLLKQLCSLTQRLHDPPCWQHRDLMLTMGSQDGLDKAFSMLVNPGDFVLVEEPCYSAVISSLKPYQVRFLPIETDAEGMKPEALRSVLSRWNPQEVREATEDFPKFLYTNPTGANPSGGVLGEARRREIYAIACEYNFLILEDDPYYLQVYLEQPPPSFLRIDTECRVLRFDSFSKTLGGGLRVGYAIGAKALIDKMVLHAQVSSQCVSLMSQVIVSELLRKWGEDGFLKHSHNITLFYKQQRDAIVASAEKHLKGLCEWAVPAGGLFLWIKVTCLKDTTGMLLERAKKRKLVLVPGNAFMTDSSKPCPFIRVSFSFNTIHVLDEAMKRLADLIKDEMEFSASTGNISS
ncbi:kynurenine/alpha-aminoadipate aminotransferase, mitochondrial-like isoform X2 [Penaeus monodon]|uniref:kynurenine/alpha-aminoadipate aminotransferase, mitochondrial-like isoform X2 n=1 Tax=Penaeus monodon TaxID=6687 RepID=UPI0018A78DE8|nr:kynurenine/alpha-aminoadipate aminotransferase, mitochondrial-like isoform X2 [Penaeus monodon]